MAKKLNYSKIMEESERSEISPYLIIKRKYNYREASTTETHRCKNCKSFCKVETKRDTYNQCKTIGVGCDGYSEVNPEYTCDAHN